MEIQTL